jgi:proteasome accessory factor B
MSKETYIPRISLIIKCLERGPASFKQIANYLENASDIQEKNFSISKRTLQRDIKDIYSQFNIEIVNEKKGENRYKIISRAENKEHSQRLLESYQIINAINASQDFAEIVFLETRKPKGLEHFHGLLYAIKENRILEFNHYKYWDDSLTKRKVHPLGLKETQGRWYLIAVDTKDKILKTFGLDRIEDLDIYKNSFREKYSYKLNEIFNNSFGIIKSDEKNPELVQLQFNYEQGQYIKTFPLHNSQKVLMEDKNGILVELLIYISIDFERELMKYSDALKVLKPESLKRSMKEKFETAIKNL